ncbi:pPIWI_RE module domain-containing protein [Actinokineospora sp. 24-640]
MVPLIRLTAYDLDPSSTPWLHDFKTIRFAQEWRTEVARRYSALFRRPEAGRTVPIRQLTALLHAAVPDVVAAPGAATDDQLPWLYAAEPVPRTAVNHLVNAWVTTILSRKERVDENDVDDLLDALDDAMPEWVDTTVDLSANELTKGGTANPHRRLYSLLPEVVAARLAARTYKYDGAELSFRVVTTSKGTELVSWPPRSYLKGKRTWHYSLLLRVSLHTVPFSGRVRVHITSGVRRWETGDPVKLDPQRGAMAYLQVPLPWMVRAGSVPRLIPNLLRHDAVLGVPAWHHNSLVRLLPEYSAAFPYPEADELLNNPSEWARGRDGVSAWVVHRTGLATHRAKTGLMPVERRHVDSWVEQALSGNLLRAADMGKVTLIAKPDVWGRVKPNPEAKAEARVVRGRARRKACAAALGGRPLVVDVRYENERTRDALVTALREVLDLAPTTGAQVWHTEELDIRVEATTWDLITADLPVPRAAAARRRAALSAALERRTAIVEHFGTPGPDAPIGLTLIELRDADKFGPDRDPKTAIRLGCADARRVSQFITTDEKALADRARSAVLDGLRQLGAVMPPRHRLGTAVPEDMQYVGLWMVRKQRTTTRSARRALVAVRTRPFEDGQRVEGWDEHRKAWVAYPELLLSLTRDTDRALSEPDESKHLSLSEQRAVVQAHIRSILYQLRSTPTLLLVQAANLRQSWPWLTNASLVRDMLGFGDWPPQRAALFGPDLRVVLFRDSGGRDEVPQWYAPRDDDRFAGHASGVWEAFDAAPGNRVFASTTEVPVQGARPNQAIKFQDGTTSRGADVSAWNPEYRELTVLACKMTTTGEPENPKTWAVLAHQLRHVDDYVPLAKPLVLHLAERAEQYVLPLFAEKSDRGNSTSPEQRNTPIA